MANQVIPNATSATLADAVLSVGELVWDTTIGALRVGDGVTPGGLAIGTVGLMTALVTAGLAPVIAGADQARIDAQAAAASVLPTIGVSRRIVTRFEGYPAYWTVAMDTAGAARLVLATDDRRFTHYSQDIQPLAARLAVVEATDPISKSDAGFISSRKMTFEGYPERCKIVKDTAGAPRLVECYDARRFNQALFGVASATVVTPAAVPTEWDIIAVLGQSNADGRGAGRVALPAASALVWKGGALVALADPVGIESNSAGSAWPAFAQRWLERTGRGVILVPCARGGTTLIDSADSGFGTWGVAGGSFSNPTLRERAVANINAAKAAATAAGLAWQFAAVVWSEGETCAGRITAGTTTAAAYAAGFAPLLEYVSTGTGAGAKLAWIIARTGFPNNADTTGAQAVRAAQEQWCRDHAHVWMGWTGAITLPRRAMMLNSTAGELHYNQAGYDEMGRSLATVASAVALGHC